ncbi:MAG: rhomboid family intramembrane serine protease [Paludibacteraceae bacterium]|nr:rhomboid family intramembrane serine protease [Paludibacteraceae bacterium]
MSMIKVTFNAPITLTFLTLMFVFTIANYMTGGLVNNIFGCSNELSYNPMIILGYFTHIFCHANLEHFFGNAIFLLLLMPLLEEKYGKMTLIIMIFSTALITGILNALLLSTGLIGASGIVFMCIILSSLTMCKAGEIPITFILVFICYVGKEVISGVLIDDNVSRFGHIIGGCCGAVFGKLFGKEKG